MITVDDQISHALKDLRDKVHVQMPVHIQVFRKNKHEPGTIYDKKFDSYVGRIESYTVSNATNEVSIFFRGGMTAKINLGSHIMEVYKHHSDDRARRNSQD